MVVVALACLAHFGVEDDGGLHAVTGALLLVVLGFKIAVIRWWHGLGRLLPVLGSTVFVLLALTWLTSAAHFLGGGGMRWAARIAPRQLLGSILVALTIVVVVVARTTTTDQP